MGGSTQSLSHKQDRLTGSFHRLCLRTAEKEAKLKNGQDKSSESHSSILHKEHSKNASACSKKTGTHSCYVWLETLPAGSNCEFSQGRAVRTASPSHATVSCLLTKHEHGFYSRESLLQRLGTCFQLFQPPCNATEAGMLHR